MKILVVEDEPLILFVLRMDLEDAGHEVLEAADADMAIGILNSNRVDLVLTDIDMPGSMDGLNLAAAVRDRWPPVKVIVMSGKQRPDSSQLPAGARFLAKPFVPAQLSGLIGSV